jgi:tetratricopeptide (TPR) repeat protein
VLARARGRGLVEEASGVLAILLARRGSFEEAEAAVAAARDAVPGLDAGPRLARVLHRAARVQVLVGRPERAEELLIEAFDAAVRAGDEGVRATIGGTLAHVMLDQGRAEEAVRLLEEVAPSAVDDDVATQVACRSAEARALAALGRTAEAREQARRAIRLAEQTDLIDPRAGALLALAEVLRAEGRPNEATPLARRALRALERRGAVVPAERARSMLGSLAHPTAEAHPTPGPGHDEPGSPADAADEEPSVSPFAEFASGAPDLPSPPEEPGLDPALEPDAVARPAKTTGASWWSFGRR